MVEFLMQLIPLLKTDRTLAVWFLASGLLSLAFSYKSQINAWAESKPRVAGVMKIIRGVGPDPWIILQGIYLIVRGRLPPALRRDDIDTLPPPPKPPTFGGLAMLCLLAQSCTPADVPVMTEECLATYSRCRVEVGERCPKYWDAETSTWAAMPNCATLVSCKAQTLEACS